MRLNFSGRLNDVAADGVRPEDARVDMNQVRRLAHERRPRMINAGWSAYPRQLGSAQFRQIAAAVGAPCHGRHGALRRAGHGGSAPQPGATRPRVTASKPLGGARGGVIPSVVERAKTISSAVFPGQQGDPLEPIIATKAVVFRIRRGQCSPIVSTGRWTASASWPNGCSTRAARTPRGCGSAPRR